MMSRPWMAFYVADFIADTMHLSAENRGSYISLICHYWRHGGLPKDEALLEAIAGIDEAKWRVNGPILRSLFIIHNGEWKHKRIDKELQEADSKYEKRAHAGRLGGIASGISRSNASEANEAMLNQPQPQPHKDSVRTESYNATAKKRTPKASPFDILKTVVSEKTARDVIDHRKAKRSPLTSRAAELLAAAFREHGDPEGAAAAMIVNGWQGFKSEWMANNVRGGLNGHQGPITAFSRPSMRNQILKADQEAREAKQKYLDITAEIERQKNVQ